MSKRKSVLSFLLAFCMLFTIPLLGRAFGDLLSMRALAANVVDSGYCGKYIYENKNGIVYPVFIVGTNASWTLYDDGMLSIDGSGETEANILGQAIVGQEDDIKTVRISSGIEKIYVADFSKCLNISSVIVDAGNSSYMSKDGVLYSKNGSQLLLYPPAKQGSSFVTPAAVQELCSSSFQNCKNLKVLILSDKVSVIDSSAFNGSEMEKFSVPANNQSFCSVDDVLYNKEKTVLVRYPDAKPGTSFSIPEGVVSLSNNAFYSANLLKKIHIPKSTKDLGKVILLLKPSFSLCLSLEAVTVDRDNPFFCSEDGVLFNKNKSDLVYYPVYKKDRSYMIPNTVESLLSTTMFINPNLKSIIFPKSFKGFNILTGVMSETYQPHDIYYEGSEEEWAQLDHAAELKNKMSSSTFHFNSKGPEKNLYNLGEETYSFVNYDDRHDGFNVNNHCHGMSMTSAGYYLGLLDVQAIGLDSPQDLYSATMTKTVTDPICNYQAIQGTYLSDAIVAGNKGTIREQWQSAVNYVKDHAYDGKGALTITIRTVIDGMECGHALVFLRYENVNGQGRIYAYDCETPDTETYFYLTSTGVRQGPDNAAYAGFDINKAFALNDVAAYFENAKGYQPGRVIYALSGEITVDGALVSTMVGKIGDTPWMMYELPTDASEAKITAQKDNATFSYMNREYEVKNTDGNSYMLFPLVEISIPGDVSGDGAVTAEDARLALRAAVGLESYEKGSAEFLAADASKDGVITAEDARLILRAAVGLETLA